MLYQKIAALQHNEIHKYRFLGEGKTYYSCSPQDLYHKGKRVAINLQHQGVGKGDCVGLILDKPEDFICGFIGCIMAGAVAVPISPPNIGAAMSGYARMVVHIVAKSEARFVLASEHLYNELHEEHAPDAVTLLSFTAIDEPVADSLVEYTLTPQDTCFIQFTSGSTGAPKGVVVSYDNLSHNVHGIATNIGLTHEDRSVSWLPLYHDMGLIGKVLTPLYYQCYMTYIPTRRFIRLPSLWLKALSDFKATITFAPNFAYSLVEKRYRNKDKGDLDLSHLRVVGCGAEPINAKVLDRFCQSMGRFGLKREAVMPCYGMAEATLALTFDNLDKPLKSVIIDKHQYYNLKVAVPTENPENALSLVSCGTIFDGHKLRIMDKHGYPLGENQVGQITAAGPSITQSYINDPNATMETFQDGWLYTGDLGFIHDGELYVSGRIKDVIIVNGRNIYPQDIEWQLEQIAGIREGNSIAVGISNEDSESFVVLCEVKRPEPDIVARITALCRQHVGLIPDDVVLVKPGTLPKTTSGKVRRNAAKQQYLTGLYDNTWLADPVQ